MKLVIDRNKWLRGEGPSQSRLIRSNDNQMCCLGFLGKACGISEQELFDEYTPETAGDENKWPNGIFNEDAVENSDITAELMEINDDENLTDENRESNLIERFATINIEVEFVG